MVILFLLKPALAMVPARLRAFCLLCLLLGDALAQTYKPDYQAEKKNKFREDGRLVIDIRAGLDATKKTIPRCKHELDLLWHQKLDTVIFGTPVIADLHGDGRKDILVAGLTGLYAIDGETGKPISGAWPIAVSDDELVASPLLFDIDRDGKDELVVSTHRGYVLFFSHKGDFDIEFTLKVPPLYLLKDWNAGKTPLNASKDDHNVDIYDDNTEPIVSHDSSDDEPWEGEPGESEFFDDYPDVADVQELDEQDADFALPDQEMLREIASNLTEMYNTFRERWTPEGLKSLELFLPAPPTVSHNHKEMIASRSYQRWWGKHKPSPNDLRRFVEVPGHLIESPVIADLDRDGHMEIILAVSYSFPDHAEFDALYGGEGLSSDDYAAGAVVVFDLRTLEMKWILPLDVTTEHTEYKGFIYGPPTVVDIEGDGQLEIVVGTGSGMIYVIDNRGHWRQDLGPMMMDVIYAGVTAEDIDGDGHMDLIASDRLGNVVVFDSRGSEKWEARVSGSIHANAVAGDLNNDGYLDVIVATDEGGVYGFSGKDGSLLPNFPVHVGDSVRAVPLLLRMSEKDAQLHIVIATTNGRLFVINSFDGCTESLEFGGSSHSMVLADDFLGNGTMSLVVTTDEGDVYLVGTQAPYDPLWAWTSPSRGRNVFSYTSEETQGVRFTADMRRRDHIAGEEFAVEFEIFDGRDRAKFTPPIIQRKYTVQILIGSRMLYMDTVFQPGYYRFKVPCPPVRVSTVLKVRLTNEHGQVFEDSFTIDVNSQFYRIIKWILAVPFLAMTAMILGLDNVRDFFALPS